jgi:hypothetical protein
MTPPRVKQLLVAHGCRGQFFTKVVGVDAVAVENTSFQANQLKL